MRWKKGKKEEEKKLEKQLALLGEKREEKKRENRVKSGLLKITQWITS